MTAAFLRQAKACEDLGSPFTALVCTLFSQRHLSEGAVRTRLENWPGDPSADGDAVPLRLAGALHALVLSGRAPFLAANYPGHQPTPDSDGLWQAIDHAQQDHGNFILQRLNLPPQTNEVRRAAVLLPGFLSLAHRYQRPLQLYEVGASAGLNLFWDSYGYDLGGTRWGPDNPPLFLTPDWQGPPPPRAEITVAGRAGCDLAPLDPGDMSDQLRLLSYIWADQQDRVARTLAALEVAAASDIRVTKADALVWLESQLANRPEGRLSVVYHSIAWQYLPPAAQARGAAIIARAGQASGQDSPLAWLRLEGDGQQPGAALLLDCWSAGVKQEETRLLARADYHGRWIHWI
tara:strand:+ start:13544 stop:14587 length:1044 start_codon:yes stop_codon:yes gene_type:complete